MSRFFPEFAGKSTSQPVPEVTPGDVERVVRRDFVPEQYDHAITALRHCVQRECSRVQLAVLKLANGDLEALRHNLEIAKRDYRDVLAPAEYPEYAKRGVFDVPRLPAKERKRIIDSDWKQYEEWLRR